MDTRPIRDQDRRTHGGDVHDRRLAEHLARRFSSRAAPQLGLATIAAAGGALGFSPNTGAFFACLSAYGAGLGIVDAAANTQAVSIQHAYGRFVLSSFHAVWSVGAIAGALFVAATSALGVGVAAAQLTAAFVVAGSARCGPRQASPHRRLTLWPFRFRSGPTSARLWCRG
ncbi:MFS transporter [Rhodococcus sp. T7]|uniref:MFS transporter n=1 Tax=Rhodococcus sp. T7 TaxID=627444 RepID=UPI0013CAD2BA|nr:hypothetical protein [Rhodococcus sp. T7]KAF0961583.1 hypothetical protein MLGJGCBP_05334 [Rhodococcus sp. T7]